MDAGDRTRGALLAGLTVAALAVGGWWWREAAPATGPIRPTPSPSTLEPLMGRTFEIDPATGGVVGVWQTDPEDPEILPEEVDAAQVNRSRTIWQDRSHLRPDADPLVRQVNAAPDDTFLLTIDCTGEGTLMVTYSGVDADKSEGAVTCPTAQLTIALTASGGPLLLQFTAHDGAIDLDARLASMF
ncbi:hypothetical protein AB0C02_09925 [Micromonospora sp. NPDC048999]|uniref:hypothetical protein n=1 Tax=Micromonospora sp. NPDC048999 TaxID=3155391 RepID=UPI0033CA6C24